MKKLCRQGDVLLVKIDAVPEGLRSDNPAKCILAYGEVSGHHHRFEGGAVTAFYKEPVDGENIVGGGVALRGTPTEVAFIDVPAAGAALVHEEHDAIAVEPGQYEIRRQREYVAPDVVRQVID